MNGIQIKKYFKIMFCLSRFFEKYQIVFYNAFSYYIIIKVPIDYSRVSKVSKNSLKTNFVLEIKY